MVQWFNRFKLFLLKLLGVRPVSVSLNILETEAEIQKSALIIHSFAKDEVVDAFRKLLRAQQTRSLFALSSFGGSIETLHKLQGHLQAIEGLLKFIEEAESLSAEEARRLRAMRQSESKGRVLKMGIKQRQDVVI